MAKKKVKVIYDRDACIGATTCAVVAPKFWVMNKDGKADLKDAKKNSEGKYELVVEVDDDEYKKLKESAKACPVQVIELAD